jgi:enoyl-CoA hydratase
MSGLEDGSIDLEIEGAIAIITMNRPKIRNAFNLAAAQQLSAYIDAIEANDSVQVGIITGGNCPAFSAGLDLQARLRGEPRPTVGNDGFAGFVRRRRTKPFVAAVNGYAVGGGLEIALTCELIVASPNATFSLPEPLRGLIAGGDCLPTVLRRLPLSVAWEVALTGRQITAAEALQHGMINAVSSNLMQDAKAMATKVLASAPQAIRGTMQLMNTFRPNSSPNYDALVEAMQKRLMASNDAREGAKAFAEKRQPVWTNT